MFSLPLTQSPGNVAVRSNLANFGALGLGDVELHHDRLHEVVTRRTTRGTTDGTAASATAAAPMARTSSRTRGSPGSGIQLADRLGSWCIVPA